MSGTWPVASHRIGADVADAYGKAHATDPVADLGEEHGHRVLRVCGKGTKVVLPTSPGLNFGRRPALPVERTCAGIAQRYEDA